jgi:hypothetical protein
MPAWTKVGGKTWKGGTVLAPPAPPLTNPIATSCTPPGGPIAGGTPVQIHGTGFTGASYVDFGGSPCGPTGKDFVVVDDTLITCQSPAHAAGAVYLTISNPEFNYGSDAPVYTYA